MNNVYAFHTIKIMNELSIYIYVFLRRSMPRGCRHCDALKESAWYGTQVCTVMHYSQCLFWVMAHDHAFTSNATYMV